MADVNSYEERVSSRRTTALFVILAVASFAEFAWWGVASGSTGLGVGFLCLTLFFAFHTWNYRTLTIAMSAQGLRLQFGVVGWTIPWETVDRCEVDDMSLWRVGGAGLHFTFRRGRYRAMFNVLEHPRVVIVLRERRGLVRDVVFSTRRPEEVMQRVRAAASSGRAI